MAKARAFIVAVETYAAMQEGLAASLPGTHDAAVAFRKWLIDEHGLAASDIYFCTENPAVTGRTAGAARQDIVSELFRLKSEGKDSTAELYFLYIGHGFCYRDAVGVRLADVLLCADYQRREISGNACLRIDEIQSWLRLCMGPADHYYFIDACRNDIGTADLNVGTLGLRYSRSSLGTPTVYTLYSVVEGTVAAADSGFVSVLVEALDGTGRAKVWYGGGKMAVLFRSVKDYVGLNLTGQQIDQRIEGGGEGLIRLIAPPPNFTCSVAVANALPADAFVLTVTDSRQTVVASIPFVGPTASFKRPPDDYMLAVTATAATVEPVDSLPADLYDDRTVRFVKRTPASGGPGAASHLSEAVPIGPDGALDVSILAAPALQLELRNLQTGDIARGAGGFSGRLAPGSYSMKISDVGRNVTFGRDTVEIGGEAPVALDLRNRGLGDLHGAWLSNLDPAVVAAEGFDFSETLGPTGDTGMDLWLALFGASHIVADPGDFSKLDSLPLATFEDAVPDGSELYLLASIEPVPDRVALGLSAGAEVEMHVVAPHPTLPGVFEQRLSTGPGFQFVSLALGNRPPISVGAYLAPNCVTLLTATTDETGGMRVQQLLLPIRRLADRLPPPVSAYFRNMPLGSVRQMVEVQRRFAGSRNLGLVLSDDALEKLIALEWFEPITAFLAGYDLQRRGDVKRLARLVVAMRKLMYGVPDIEALAKIAGLEWQMPDVPPLVLDGLLSLNMPAALSKLDMSHLDFRGPWATWTGAVAVRDAGASSYGEAAV